MIKMTMSTLLMAISSALYAHEKLSAQINTVPETQTIEGSDNRQKLSFPSPFTADQLWQKILQLGSRQNAFFTQQDIKKIFNISMTLNKDQSTGETVPGDYTANDHVAPRASNNQWYQQATFSMKNPTGHKPSVDFQLMLWGTISNVEDNICITKNYEELRTNLKQRGWVWGGSEIGRNDYRIEKFIKDDSGYLELSFGDNGGHRICLIQVEISSRGSTHWPRDSNGNYRMLPPPIP